MWRSYPEESLPIEIVGTCPRSYQKIYPKIIDSTVAAVLTEYRWRISPDLVFQSLV
jgi:hypothetical protein